MKFGNSGTGARILAVVNPHDGPYFEVTHDLAPAVIISCCPIVKETSFVLSFHLNSTAVWDPAIDGPIATVDYSERARTRITEFNSFGGKSGPLLEQGGDLYTWSFQGTRLGPPFPALSAASTPGP
ncbi:MAG: hypothetical protein MK134_07240 [Dehalococcoidia bacterium]|nr:hypothetical protein [Dehalococcoidia bacterium]